MGWVIPFTSNASPPSDAGSILGIIKNIINRSITAYNYTVMCSNSKIHFLKRSTRYFEKEVTTEHNTAYINRVSHHLLTYLGWFYRCFIQAGSSCIYRRAICAHRFATKIKAARNTYYHMLCLLSIFTSVYNSCLKSYVLHSRYKSVTRSRCSPYICFFRLKLNVYRYYSFDLQWLNSISKPISEVIISET